MLYSIYCGQNLSGTNNFTTVYVPFMPEHIAKPQNIIVTIEQREYGLETHILYMYDTILKAHTLLRYLR